MKKEPTLTKKKRWRRHELYPVGNNSHFNNKTADELAKDKIIYDLTLTTSYKTNPLLPPTNMSIFFSVVVVVVVRITRTKHNFFLQ